MVKLTQKTKAARMLDQLIQMIHRKIYHDQITDETHQKINRLDNMHFDDAVFLLASIYDDMHN
tara:strand:+ start:318 stop:506 length:189 start_codon:yes stop_codon:yes gene_type:complete